MQLETQIQNPQSIPTPPILETDLTPLSVIRTETVLSKLPVHNLSKKGKVNIQIFKTGPKGQVELKWEVSYSDRYGQARQLAYKLDTIIVDQRIEEAGRPLPETVKLGSLRQFCEELGLAESGKNLKDIKRAFLQNAFAGITAKFKYKSNDGIERTLEAAFTRYSVIFTGEKLPDGRKADAVYVAFSPPYREVLNNAPVRPLDLDYKKQLPPAAQRFYEIVSYKIFAALKYNQPFARLSYAEYCTFSAQQRYFTRQPVQNQMNRIHREHKKSGYITAVQYEETTDEQGSPDWILCYTPGPKARAEFAFANGKRRKLDITAALPDPEIDGVGERTTAPRSRRTGPRQRHLNLQPMEPSAIETSDPLPAVDQALLSELTKRGVGETDARKLLAGLPADQPVLDQLEWGDFQINQQPGKITNPPGFYISLLQRNISPPPTFETSRQQAARVEAESARQRKFAEQQAAATRLEEALRQKAEEQLGKLSPEEYQTLYTEMTAEYFQQYPKQKLFADRDMTQAVIRRRMREHLQLRLEDAGESASFPDIQKVITTLQLPAPREAKATGLAPAPSIKSTVL